MRDLNPLPGGSGASGAGGGGRAPPAVWSVAGFCAAPGGHSPPPLPRKGIGASAATRIRKILRELASISIQCRLLVFFTNEAFQISSGTARTAHLVLALR